jgi:uncharacterized C2H2 Zn-finger protein
MSVECEICGKVFNDSAKGYKAHWYYKAHKNTCFTKFKKKQRKFIKDYSQNASDIEINRLYEFIKNPELFNSKPEKINQCIRITNESPQSDIYHEEPIPDRPKSNDTISSNESEIETENFYYEGFNYGVDKKDRDKDQWNEYKLIYD